ncbi:MAG: YqaA family protein [Roseibium album]|uniref:SNARE associated Golgi protein n=1 Tax=Roseibium album TaxID=311410 RepID=A0A0M6Z6H0_9HYPH|nr:YqaA family protein [Roseibium album]MBG6144054.1 membrane protein YqaA with SNARE-associated domain [Labrenzia sp. EL_142]MBG6162905.1 membrane protein YqaA with SNARE-associated domain [Labrenzia sp. EL_195]MBG6174701.1 membrane protein YqaA with SNARE-associated domain [Labrenzia sp. EL_132]MBG6207575.1 membrane protein YqaA with SNARE-associated domain [Labrenzia sp. EL_126]MBG6229017.1 membrane protein YqaA with SNARE-associated domain [Labrenzia sp. EL_208]MCR9059957.1 DedA family pr
MIRRLYDWTLSLAAGPRAPAALGSVSFVESSVFPIPPDILLIPMVIARREKAWWYALLCTVASVAGGVLGYLIGMFLFEQVAVPILSFYGKMEKFDEFRDVFNHWGWWFVFIAGLTPFPYKVITIASGVAGLSLPVFVVASIVSRGLRFFVVAGLLYLFGPVIKDFIEKRLGLMFTLFVVLLVGGFILLRYI